MDRIQHGIQRGLVALTDPGSVMRAAWLILRGLQGPGQDSIGILGSAWMSWMIARPLDRVRPD